MQSCSCRVYTRLLQQIGNLHQFWKSTLVQKDGCGGVLEEKCVKFDSILYFARTGMVTLNFGFSAVEGVLYFIFFLLREESSSAPLGGTTSKDSTYLHSHDWSANPFGFHIPTSLTSTQNPNSQHPKSRKVLILFTTTRKHHTTVIINHSEATKTTSQDTFKREPQKQPAKSLLFLSSPTQTSQIKFPFLSQTPQL